MQGKEGEDDNENRWKEGKEDIKKIEETVQQNRGGGSGKESRSGKERIANGHEMERRGLVSARQEEMRGAWCGKLKKCGIVEGGIRWKVFRNKEV